MDTIVRVGAVAAVVVLLIGLFLQLVGSRFQPVGHNELARGFKHRGLAMQLARSTAEVEKILGTDPGNREVMRRVQAFDFAFIPSYWLLFTLSAVLLAQCRFAFATPLAILATICAAAAAVCDVWEDVFILKVTDLANLAGAQPLIDACRHASQWKWSLIFAAMLLLSPLFLFRTDLRSFLGFACAIAGLLLVVSGSYGLLSLPRGGAIEGAGGLMALAFAGLTIVLGWAWFQPELFLSGL
jgi:hypothetical protein